MNKLNLSDQEIFRSYSISNLNTIYTEAVTSVTKIPEFTNTYEPYYKMDVLPAELDWKISDVLKLSINGRGQYFELVRNQILMNRIKYNHPSFTKGLSKEKFDQAFDKFMAPDCTMQDAEVEYTFRKADDENYENSILIEPTETGKIKSTAVNQFFPEMYDVKINGKSAWDQIESESEFNKNCSKILNLFNDSIENGELKPDTKISTKLFSALKTVNWVQTAGNFPVPVAKYIFHTELKRFSKEDQFNILDTCAGWGARMVASSSLIIFPYKDTNINYYCTDVNQKSHPKFGQIYKYLTNRYQSMKNNFRFYKSTVPAEDIFSDEKFVSMKGKFHIMLTSPPYFNKEIYSNDTNQSSLNFRSYNSWVLNFLQPTIYNTYELLRPGGIMAFNIADTYKRKDVYYQLECDTHFFAKKTGFNYLRTYLMPMNLHASQIKKAKEGKSKANIIKIGEDNYKKFEPIFIYQKPYE